MSSLFDLQVNGYAGVDFNQDNLTEEDLGKACAALRRDGVENILATIITEDIPVMAARIARIAELRYRIAGAAETIVGLHIEGPFLSPETGYHGCHPQACVRLANLSLMHQLVDAGQGLVRMVTLAPEMDEGFVVTRHLVDSGIVVAAGHCNPNLDTLMGAIDAGLSMFTHLGNACPMHLHRHDNVIQRALHLRNHLRFTFIADGAHVPFFALRNYIDLIGVERCAVVSDAIAPAGLGPGRYTLGRWDVQIGEDRVARAPDGSHLIGSALGLAEARRNLVEHVQLNNADADMLTSANPRSWVGSS